MPSDLDELIRIFRELGADDPEAWAQSLVKEGNLQLQRFFALRQAWKLVDDEGDDSWIESILANGKPDEIAIGRIIERLLTLGVDRAVIGDLPWRASRWPPSTAEDEPVRNSRMPLINSAQGNLGRTSARLA